MTATLSWLADLTQAGEALAEVCDAVIFAFVGVGILILIGIAVESRRGRRG